MGHIDCKRLLSLTKQFGKGEYGRYLDTLSQQLP
jgi:hypothetical protein